MKIVGLQDMREVKRKRDNQPMNAWMVYYLGPGRNVIGDEARGQFVDAPMFADALNVAGCTAPSDVIGRECTFGWNRNGFLDVFSVSPQSK